MSKIIKVIKIINDESLVINAGVNDYIKNGDSIEIYQPGIEVFDPDSNESLGSLDYVKATLEVINALPKMSVCKSIVYKERSTIDMIGSITVRRTKTLKIDPEEISGGYEGMESVIRIGDLARKV